MKFRFKKFIEELALGAGRIQLHYLDKTHRVERKRNAGIVTEADKNAENYLLKKIFRKFPNSSIITEESGEYRRQSNLRWIIDPLDGTSNFAHGFPFFCVSIGIEEDGELVAGAVYAPVLKELFFAERGLGAYRNGKRIRVSKTSSLRDSLLGTGFYYSKGFDLKREMKIFSRMNELVLGVRRPGAAAIDLAYVACGRYDGFWERKLSPWDVAAGYVLVSEAGGKITDYSGNPTDIFGKECVASNSLLHRKIVNQTR